MMKYMLIFFFFIIYSYAPAQDDYETYFTDDVLRIDFILAGDKANESIYLAELKKEAHWAGPGTNYMIPFDYGNYRIQVKSEEDRLIYRRGFSTLFEEYQTTEKAKNQTRSFYQTIRVPYPKDTVDIFIQKRTYETGKFITLLEKQVDPGDYFINKEGSPDVEYDEIMKAGAGVLG